MEFFLFVLCGLISGILGGMLGIGSGVITVPALYFFFHYSSMFEVRIMQVSASTSLAITLLVSIAASIAQHAKKTIFFPALKFLAPGLIIGCISGACLAHLISSGLIHLIFGIGALLIGLYFSIPNLPHLNIAASPNPTLSWFGILIGTLSSLLGIGGGILSFPTFLGYGMDGKAASATSSCATALSSFVGTLTYLVIAWKNPKLPYTFGYIEMHAFLIIGISALITAPLGVKLSHILNVRLIKQIFGVCLSLVGLTMMFL